MNQGLFLDRDGVVNYDYGHVGSISDFVFRPEIFSIASAAAAKKFIIVIVTNQAGIGRGLYTTKQFRELDAYMIRSFKSKGINVAHTYFCPYHPIHGKGHFKRPSYLRKPNPGMLVQACQDYDINPRYSLMIGDKSSDYLAAMSSNIGRYVDSSVVGWDKEAIDALCF